MNAVGADDDLAFKRRPILRVNQNSVFKILDLLDLLVGLDPLFLKNVVVEHTQKSIAFHEHGCITMSCLQHGSTGHLRQPLPGFTVADEVKFGRLCDLAHILVDSELIEDPETVCVEADAGADVGRHAFVRFEEDVVDFEVLEHQGQGEPCDAAADNDHLVFGFRSHGVVWL